MSTSPDIFSTPDFSAHMSEIGRRGARTKKIAAVERRIRELAESAEPLTDEQRDRLVVLLRGTPA